MVQLKVKHEEDRTLPDGSIHGARLMDIVEKTITWVDRKSGEDRSSDLLEWWFEIEQSSDQKFIGRRVKGTTDALITDRSNDKFRDWLEKLTGAELREDDDVDTDDVLGLPCQIVISHRLDKKDSSRVYEQVDTILPNDSSSYDEPPF